MYMNKSKIDTVDKIQGCTSVNSILGLFEMFFLLVLVSIQQLYPNFTAIPILFPVNTKLYDCALPNI